MRHISIIWFSGQNLKPNQGKFIDPSHLPSIRFFGCLAWRKFQGTISYFNPFLNLLINDFCLIKKILNLHFKGSLEKTFQKRREFTTKGHNLWPKPKAKSGCSIEQYLIKGDSTISHHCPVQCVFNLHANQREPCSIFKMKTNYLKELEIIVSMTKVWKEQKNLTPFFSKLQKSGQILEDQFAFRELRGTKAKKLKQR